MLPEKNEEVVSSVLHKLSYIRIDHEHKTLKAVSKWHPTISELSDVYDVRSSDSSTHLSQNAHADY